MRNSNSDYKYFIIVIHSNYILFRENREKCERKENQNYTHINISG